MLDDLGLVPTLKWLFDRYGIEIQLHVTYEHEGLGRRFHPDIEIAAYRIVQEALTNVARHSETPHAHVNLSADEYHLIVRVADQGKGFDAEQDPGGIGAAGVVGMRERASSLGGQLVIESILGEGTLVTAHLPLNGNVGNGSQP